ncbi:MAG: 4-hydroxy-tetrahydrodipicolinate reductase (EC [uncultured Campylobacterales bacterium]|uniref:4-hydroxy-tetrahydrodipicolinate reductase n=1 Tax=uncultured Campylobacterales bacterium TaxID=352960 RepID=A0A6S6SLC3_9BACT|nr:MAG: 4-hydroxy-tetrahydrodipicolinate reductase (EC [uncultured Campylobacterales bacterium]
MIKILINGAKGKMGTFSQKIISNNPKFKIVGLDDIEDNLSEQIKLTKPDVVLDLTWSSSVYENTKTIIDAGVRPVIGTSGLTLDQINEFKKICEAKKLGGIVVPSFSVTAVLMMIFAQKASKYLKNAEIIEYYHDKKLEAPSSTVRKLAEMTAKSNVNSRQRGEESIPNVLGGEYQNIPIHSIRMPGVLANQEILFGEPGETLQIKSTAINQECFTKGIFLSCQEVMNRDKLYYGLEHFIDLS